MTWLFASGRSQGSLPFLRTSACFFTSLCASAIGVAEPTSIMIETFGTSRLSNERLTQIVRANFDLTPYGLREMLDLARPIYRKSAAYGHFGRTEPEFTWEKTDRAEALAVEGKSVRAA